MNEPETPRRVWKVTFQRSKVSKRTKRVKWESLKSSYIIMCRNQPANILHPLEVNAWRKILSNDDDDEHVTPQIMRSEIFLPHMSTILLEIHFFHLERWKFSLIGNVAKIEKILYATSDQINCLFIVQRLLWLYRRIKFVFRCQVI